MANYQKLVDMEEKWGKTDNEMPVVFIGTDLLAGEKETEGRIEEFVRKYAQAGGVDWPKEPANTKPAVTPGTSSEKASHQPPDTPSTLTAGNVSAQKTPASPMLPKSKPDAVQPTPPDEDTKLKGDVATINPPTLSPAGTPDTAGKPAHNPSPKVNGQENRPVYLGLFYQISCKECDRIFYLLKYLKKKHPLLVVEEFDLAERKNKVLYEAIAVKEGVPEKKRLIPATVFVGSDYLLLEDIKQRKIEGLIARYENTGSTCPWEVSAQELAAAEKGIVDRFKSLGSLTVALAGLLDGVNPCAFTTLIFFISYLMYLGKKGRQILAVGASFAGGVFIAYFLVGCGAFSFLKYITGSHMVTRIVNLVVAAGAFTLGIISFLDYLKARKGNYKDISLQLPGVLKKRIHNTVRTSMRTSQHTAAAFLAGLTVSVLELACTGQVYLPTIIFVTSQQGMRQSGLAYLLLYNLMFILPLVGIFLIAYRGVTSEKLAALSRTHMATVKLGLALFFVAMGTFLVLS